MPSKEMKSDGNSRYVLLAICFPCTAGTIKDVKIYGDT
jgi:hypothetical protein